MNFFSLAYNPGDKNNQNCQNITGKDIINPLKNATLSAVKNVSCTSIATIEVPSGSTAFTGTIIQFKIGSYTAKHAKNATINTARDIESLFLRSAIWGLRFSNIKHPHLQTFSFLFL